MEVDRELEASGRPGRDGGNREVDAVQHSTNSKRAAVSRANPAHEEAEAPMAEAGESLSSEDETSAAAGCLRAPDPGSSRLDLDSAHPPPNPENALIRRKVHPAYGKGIESIYSCVPRASLEVQDRCC